MLVEINFLKVIDVNDENVDIDSFRTMLKFVYNAYENVDMNGESALGVLYIGKCYLYDIFCTFNPNF